MNRHLASGLGYASLPLLKAARLKQLAAAVWTGDDELKLLIVTAGMIAFLLAVLAQSSSALTLDVVRHDVPTIATVDASTTALVVMDFWDVDFGDPGSPSNLAVQNVVQLISFARRNGIPVVHAPHEGEALHGLHPAVLPLPSGDGILAPAERLESYFAERNLNIKTVLLAGFSIEECVLFTRDSSLNELARRGAPFDMVLVKDATHGSYWGYKFALRGIESAYASTTLDDLAAAFRDDIPANPILLTDPNWSRAYTLDESLGSDIAPSATALVLFNVTDDWADQDFRARVADNLTNNVLPLLAFARSRGFHVVFVSDRPTAADAGRLEGEAEVFSVGELVAELESRSIDTVLYAGNLTSKRGPLPTIDVWGFTTQLPFAGKTRFLEDALIVRETPESIDGERFKHAFVERASAYGGDSHRVSTAAILMGNMS